MTETTIGKCPTCGNLLVSKEVGPLTMCENSRAVTWRGISIKISTVPFRILNLLVQNAGHSLSRDHIHSKLFAHTASPHNVTVSIMYLRSAFKKIDPTFDCIKTMPFIGYVWKYEP